MQENKFPTSEFISFLNSISSHSSILAKLFKDSNAMTSGSATATAAVAPPADVEVKSEATDGSAQSPDRAASGTSRGGADSVFDGLGGEEEELNEELSPVDLADLPETELDRAQHTRRIEEVQVCCAGGGVFCVVRMSK